MRTRLAALSLTLALAACSPSSEQEAAPSNESGADQTAQEPLSPPEPGTAGGLPAGPGTPAGEPRGPIDPESTEAAGQIVQQLGALIEQKRFAEARALWSDPAAADRFQSVLSGYAAAHLQIGGPSAREGAAGSSTVNVPVVVYGRRVSGPEASAPAEVILRRVNDGPGSTEAQRRWRIERIDFKSPD